MSQTLTVENRDYIPAGKVGKHFGYTRDYILMLARDGKIDGRKIGHRWYVNLESAEKFFHEAKILREEKKQEIRQVRKAELRTHQITRKNTHERPGLIGALAFAVFVFVIGFAGYVSVRDVGQHAMVVSGDISFFEKVAVSLYNLISPEPFVLEERSELSVPQENSRVVNVPEVVEEDQTTATRTTRTSLIIGPGEVLTTTKIESIADSFSDDVSISIDPHNPDAGIIIPHFKDGDGEEYRYLIVPVTEGLNQ
jgi:hypothetical protein